VIDATESSHQAHYQFNGSRANSARQQERLAADRGAGQSMPPATHAGASSACSNSRSLPLCNGTSRSGSCTAPLPLADPKAEGRFARAPLIRPLNLRSPDGRHEASEAFCGLQLADGHARLPASARRSAIGRPWRPDVCGHEFRSVTRTQRCHAHRRDGITNCRARIMDTPEALGGTTSVLC
jgi:hypothetical protein